MFGFGPYRYSDLPPQGSEIRLLRIERGLLGDPIRCEIFESYPDRDEATYQALSYVWGPSNQTHSIQILGWDFYVNEALHTALRHIRRPTTDIVLWVDAICINQLDRKEKALQVSQMGRIYEAAEEVLVWLGVDDMGGSMEALIQYINAIDARATEYKALGRSHDHLALCLQAMSDRSPNERTTMASIHREAMQALLRRQWFQRIWILQEIARARMARIVCGEFSCPARTFALMPSLMGLDVDEQTQVVLDIMPRVRQKTWWSSKRDLHSLLIKFSHCQATIERDKIYALVGMSEDAHDPDVFPISYSTADVMVFRNAAFFLMFGRQREERCALPAFDVGALSLPLHQLAEQTLTWALGSHENDDARDKARQTAALLIDRVNEGKIDMGGFLLPLAERYGMREKVRKILLCGDAVLRLDYTSTASTLGISSGRGNAEAVQLPFDSAVSIDGALEVQRRAKLLDDKLRTTLPFPYEATSYMTPDKASSQEERLRANAWAGNTKAVESLLFSTDTDAYAADNDGFTAFELALRRGHLETVDTLMCWPGLRAETALRLAAWEGHLPIVKSLSKRMYEVDEALQLAAKRGHLAIVESLLDDRSRGQFNSQREAAMDAFHYACMEGHVDVVKSLLGTWGLAEWNPRTNPTAVQLATMNGHQDVLSVLDDPTIRGTYFGRRRRDTQQRKVDS